MVDPPLIERFRADFTPLWAGIDLPDARLGVAVSGGGDSLALLLLAQAALPGRVEAATVDHGLRVAGADEAKLVARYCAQIGVPHAILTVSVAPGNTQGQARNARYAALGDWLNQRHLNALATAHHVDDQAETFMMRLNRGSGLAGLSGIRAIGDAPGVRHPVVRPLLRWRRTELARIVDSFGWSAVDDPSNHDNSFDRVQMRKFLADTDWLDVAAIERSARYLAEANDAIQWAVGREYAECVATDGDAISYAAVRTGLTDTIIRSGVVRAIYRQFDKTLGQAAAADLVARLHRAEKANIAGIQADAKVVNGEQVWIFRPENPRRTG